MRHWGCSRSRGPAVHSSLWGVPWPSVGRLPLQPGCWAGRGGGTVSPQAVWGWVHAAGHRALETLQEPWHAWAQGTLPVPEALAADLAAAPLASKRAIESGVIPGQKASGAVCPTAPLGTKRASSVRSSVERQISRHPRNHWGRKRSTTSRARDSGASRHSARACPSSAVRGKSGISRWAWDSSVPASRARATARSRAAEIMRCSRCAACWESPRCR